MPPPTASLAFTASLPREVDGPDPDFLSDVVSGLGRRRKDIPSRWFYDARGSQIFQRIMALDAYYPTRIPLHHRSDFLGEGDPFGDLAAGSFILGFVPHTEFGFVTQRTFRGPNGQGFLQTTVRLTAPPRARRRRCRIARRRHC